MQNTLRGLNAAGTVEWADLRHPTLTIFMLDSVSLTTNLRAGQSLIAYYLFIFNIYKNIAIQSAQE